MTLFNYLSIWLFLGLCGREVLSDYMCQEKFRGVDISNPTKYKEHFDKLKRITANSYMRELLLSLLLGPITFVFLYVWSYLDGREEYFKKNAKRNNL